MAAIMAQQDPGFEPGIRPFSADLGTTKPIDLPMVTPPHVDSGAANDTSMTMTVPEATPWVTPVSTMGTPSEPTTVVDQCASVHAPTQVASPQQPEISTILFDPRNFGRERSSRRAAARPGPVCASHTTSPSSAATRPKAQSSSPSKRSRPTTTSDNVPKTKRTKASSHGISRPKGFATSDFLSAIYGKPEWRAPTAVADIPPTADGLKEESYAISTTPVTPLTPTRCRPASRRSVSMSEKIAPISFATGSPRSIDLRPQRDVSGAQIYVDQVKPVLRAKKDLRPQTVGCISAKRILQLLEIASYPSPEEAAFVTGHEAVTLLRPGNLLPVPIITEGQQALPLQTPEGFLGEFYDDDTMVSIQDSSAKPGDIQPSVRRVRIGAVKERMAKNRLIPQEAPWNLLELATHHEDGLRPRFLNDEDSRLLTKLKIPASASDARRRPLASDYKEVEKWALLAEAGALTEPHQDSHGYNTFITVNAGRIGFGWLSRPTPADRAAWCANPHHYTTTIQPSAENAHPPSLWRYVVLIPGQTIYFPSGTVHFVFRLPSDGPSLAFGGHTLRCSTLVPWVRAMVEEQFTRSAVTNEELTAAAKGHLARVEGFVRKSVERARREGAGVGEARDGGEREEKALLRWGGRREVEEFLRLKAIFEEKF